MRLRPEAHQAHYNLALSLAYQDRLRESVQHFVRARAIEPHNAGFQETLFPILVTLLQHEPAPPPTLALPSLEEKPLVSVIVPTRDRPRLLRDALESLCRQTYGNWEALVVNDGGADVSGAVDSVAGRVSLLTMPASLGPAAARNAALRTARGAVFAFLDDDDLFARTHLEGLIAGLRATSAGAAFSSAELVEETIVGGMRVERKRQPFFAGLRYSRPLLLVRNYLPINTWGVRRECFDAVGLFDEGLSYLEDWDFLLRLSRRAAFHQTGVPSAEYRLSLQAGDSVTKAHRHKPAVEAMYRRYDAGGHELVTLARELYLETL